MAYPAYSSNGGVSNVYQEASINIAYPGIINKGDFLVIFSSKDITTNNAVITHPSGFNLGPIRNSSYKGSYALTTQMYYKRADGTESGTVNMVWVAAAYTYCTAVMYRFTSVVTGGFPFDNTSGTQSTGASSSYTQKVVTTTGAERLLLGYTLLYSGAVANTVTSWFSRHTNNQAGYYHKLQDRQISIAQTVGDGTGTITGVTSHWISMTFALRSGSGWSHKFLGIDNFDIKKISGLDLISIESVDSVT